MARRLHDAYHSPQECSQEYPQGHRGSFLGRTSTPVAGLTHQADSNASSCHKGRGGVLCRVTTPRF